MDYILPSEAIKKLLIESYTSPYSVSYAKNSNDKISGQIAKKQEMFLKLSENIKDKLVSSVTSERIKEIGNFFNLQLQQLADISRVIRGYYFGEIGLEDFPNILAKEIPVDINTAQQISKQIIEKIIKDESLGVNKNLVDLSLSQALKQFPNFGEQAVTSAPIKLKIFPSPVRPSVKNWIEDYRGTMGAEKHG
ncbi:MAG: hypothetical protein Q7S18_01535, partial [bacterium]|nr:hypothetical protein [bacterium]